MELELLGTKLYVNCLLGNHILVYLQFIVYMVCLTKLIFKKIHVPFFKKHSLYSNGYISRTTHKTLKYFNKRLFYVICDCIYYTNGNYKIISSWIVIVLFLSSGIP